MADLTREQDGACEALASVHASVSCVPVPAGQLVLAQGHSTQPDETGWVPTDDQVEAQYVADAGGNLWRLVPYAPPLGDGPPRPQQLLQLPGGGGE